MKVLFQIFSSLSAPRHLMAPPGSGFQPSSLPVVGSNDQGPILQWINTQIPLALKVLQSFSSFKKDKELSRVPHATSFFLNVNNTVLCSEDKNWKEKEPGSWKAWIIFDMAQYHFSTEEYSLAFKYLQSMEALKLKKKIFTANKRDEAVYNGILAASTLASSCTDSVPAFQMTSPADSIQMLKTVEKPDTPLYAAIHYELLSAFNQSDTARDIAEKNMARRIDSSHPPIFDALGNQTVASAEDKSKMLSIIRDLPVNPSLTSKLSLNSRIGEPRGKSPKLKRRIVLSHLFREIRPNKIQKLSHDLQKNLASFDLSGPITSQLNIDESIAQAFTVLPRGMEADLQLLSINKVIQLFEMGQSIEAWNLFKSLESMDRGNPAVATVYKHLELPIFGLKLEKGLQQNQLQVHDSLPQNKTVLDDDDHRKCRQFLVELQSFNVDTHESVFESCLACLVNQQDWDFIFALQEQRWKTLKLCQLILSLAVHFKGGGTGSFDVKKSCQLLFELLQTGSQQNTNAAGKRLRDAKSPSLGHWTFLKKIYHPDVLQVLTSFFAALYNDVVEEPSLRINHDFPVIAIGSSKSSQVFDANQCLDALEDLVNNCSHLDTSWVRLRGEIMFARGNHAAAIKYYLQSYVLATQFFMKAPPMGANEREDKITHKMIRCLTDQGYHGYAIAMSQLVSDLDYSVSFKNLEERRSSDCMDGVYKNLWDVTVLEYAVSMHTKRGENSRRRKALGRIGALEINTNNNVEILREAVANKRAALMRHLCRHFL